jgi:hypothetical protein
MPIYPTRLAAIVAVALLAAGSARGGTIALDAADVAVLAGGSLSADQSVTIHGSTVSFGNTWFDRDVTVKGSAYAGGSYGNARNVSITGNVVAASHVSIDKDSTVGTIDAGRDVWLGKSVQSNTITAGRGVSLSNDVTVNGDVYYGSNYWGPSSATVTGSTTRGGNPADWSLELPEAPTFTPNSGSDWYARNSSVSLTPGTYGSLSVDRDSTIRLTAGTYHFASLWLDRGTQFIADTTGGDVIVNLSSSLSTGAEVAMTHAGDGRFSLTAGGNIYLGREAEVDAHLMAFGHATIDAFSKLGGGLYAAGNIHLDQGVSVNGSFMPSGGGLGGQESVPEPATLVTVLAGLTVAFRRPRRPNDRRR